VRDTGIGMDPQPLALLLGNEGMVPAPSRVGGAGLADVMGFGHRSGAGPAAPSSPSGQAFKTLPQPHQGVGLTEIARHRDQGQRLDAL
jgi:hypothetical protein